MYIFSHEVDLSHYLGTNLIKFFITFEVIIT